MRIRTTRTQRGITLIEIILVMAIVVAATAAIFVFSKKASVTAAVETEQRQVEQITKTVQGLFATQRNFAALGTNGANYLKQHAARSGLKFTTKADGTPTVQTSLGDGRGTLTIAAADVGFAGATVAPGTANGFVLAYDDLKPAECIGLVTSTAASTAKTKVGYGGVLPGEGIGQVALRGRLDADKGKIAESCKEQGGARPTVFLFFAPARAIGAAGALAPTPAPACAPVHESQYAACPAGQVGTIRQERDGTCTGPNNAMVYTVWTTTDSTCQAAPVAPPGQTTTDPGEQCGKSKFTRAVACPSGQVGQVAQSREVDTCDGTDTGWQAVPGGNSCQTAPAATCVPQTQSRILTCPAGQGGGEIVQARSSTCSSPSAAPDWTPDPLPPGFDSQGWQITSNTCTSSCVATGTCCVVKRDVRSAPCAAGTYGSAGEQEHFLGCVNATTQSGTWTPWQDSVASSCTACPATTTSTQKKWVPRNKICPVGETGTNTWEAEQARTQKTSYSCPAGTTTLPAPTVGAWSAWMDTGATRNRVDTCKPDPTAVCDGPGGQQLYNWSAPLPTIVGGGGACPAPARSYLVGSPSSTCMADADLGKKVKTSDWREIEVYDEREGKDVCYESEESNSNYTCKKFCTNLGQLCGVTNGVSHCNSAADVDFRPMRDRPVETNSIWWSGPGAPKYSDGTFGQHDDAGWANDNGVRYCQLYWDTGNPSKPRPNASASMNMTLQLNGESVPVSMSCNGAGSSHPSAPNWCTASKSLNVGGTAYVVGLRTSSWLSSSTYITQTCIDIN